MSSFEAGQARPLRWLIVAPLCVPPTGRHLGASGERFKNLMTKLGPKATVTLPDELGEAARRSVALSFGRPRDFRLTEVVGHIDVLSKLGDIAKDLERGGKVEAAISKLRSTLGDGPLLDVAVRIQTGEPAILPTPEPAKPAESETPAEPAPAAAASEGEQKGGGVSIDAIFGKADVAKAPEPSKDAASIAKSSIDAFIGAMRQSSGKKPTKAVSAGSVGRELATLLRRAAESAATELMGSPPLSTLETSWRGLRMVISASPGADDLAVDLLDSDDNQLCERIEQRLDVAPMDRPDAVFVAQSIDSVDTLAQLARVGARKSVPIVANAPVELTGVSLDDPTSEPPVPSDWAELRAQPQTKWLCVTTNAVVLANEEIGPLQRTVFGSPALAVAAMVSASVGQTGGPGQIFGRAGALVSPASYRRGQGDRAAFLSTERLATTDQQRAVGKRGMLVLSCERGSDRLRLSAAPTVHADDDLPLPGRILAGRAARFTQAIRDELPPHATEREVAARLAQASGAFLPRSQGAVALEVRTDANGKVGVDASIGAALAGASFKFSSDL